MTENKAASQKSYEDLGTSGKKGKADASRTIAIDAVRNLVAIPSYRNTAPILGLRRGNGVVPARLWAHCQCNLNGASLFPLPVAAILPLGRAAMSDVDLSESELPT